MEVKKTTFSEISNTLFIIFVLFLISFLWCNFYIRNLKNSLICSIIIILGFSIFYIPHKIKKHKKSKSCLENIEKDSYYKAQLLLSDNKDILNFITKLYNYKNIEHITDNHIIVNENLDIYIAYSENALTNDDIYNIYKNSKCTEIKVFTNTKPNQTIKILGKQLEFIDYQSLLSKCKETKTFFDNNINVEKKQKYKLKDTLCIVLGKERSKSYLLSGLLILFSSMFTPYNVYYVIISTILLALSVFSKFNTLFN